MKVITSEFLESTGYRCLFECVKKEGIKPIFELVQDIQDLPDGNILIQQKILNKENELDRLVKKNKDIICYLKEHEKELNQIKLTDENVHNTLAILLSNISLLDSYIENAKRLEALKVEFVLFKDELNSDEHYCSFIPRNEREIKYISKYYTDGKVYPRIGEERAHHFHWCHTGYNKIPFSITNDQEYSFILHTENYENFSQHREIEIMDFSFDGSKLPTEEEIQSYEIPKELIRVKKNEY